MKKLLFTLAITLCVLAVTNTGCMRPSKKCKQNAKAVKKRGGGWRY